MSDKEFFDRVDDDYQELIDGRDGDEDYDYEDWKERQYEKRNHYDDNWNE